MGDGMLAIFVNTVSGLEAALEAQRALRDAAWGLTGPLRVRMAIHTGSAESRDGDFFGPALNRDARILAIGHGGQILLSAATAVLARDGLPVGVELLDLGSHRLRDLDRPEQVYQVAVADLPRDFPPLRSLSTHRSNLPVQLTSFVGREKEIADVVALVGKGPLVTLIGTGGTGKTRLMLEAAGRLAGQFADGVWLAELAPLGEAAQILPEIARALGVPDAPDRPLVEVVTDFLAEKELLLLLDNAEHLVDGVADVAGRLLRSAPGLRILTTSREALRLPGEKILQVPSLVCPILGDRAAGTVRRTVDVDDAARTEAVRLFSERAAAVQPAFEITGENVEAVVEICRRLDGIPLALELAAARVSAMSPQEIADRLGDRFRLLAGGRRAAVPRQQTLHALIDWSWGLLNDDDRRLLRRLSVFAGGWTARAAAPVVGDERAIGLEVDVGPVVDGLARLVDRSLVVVDRGATTRYRMLETIRQYARERLIESGETADVADRHFRFFASFAETASVGLAGPAIGDWLDRLDFEIENLGVALEWGLEAEPESALRMCDALFLYWRLRLTTPSETQARLLRAIGIARAIATGPPEPTASQLALAGRSLGNISMLWGMTGLSTDAADWARDGLAFARASGDRSAIVRAVQGEIFVRVFSGAAAEVQPLTEEALSLAIADEDWDTVATGAVMYAAAQVRSDPQAAESLAARADSAASRTGNPFTIAIVALGHGRMLGVLGKVDEAREQFQRAIDRFAELGDQRLVLAARSDFGHALRRAGRYAEAEAVYRDAISGWVSVGNRGAVANILEQSAFIAIDRGDTSRAAWLLGAAESTRERTRAPMAIDERMEYATFIERLRRDAPRESVDADWRVGREMALPDAVDLVIGT
jgi:predicted ATPase